MNDAPATAVPELLRQAAAFHQQGRLDRAQPLYRRILAANPRHFDALHLLGVTVAQSNDPAGAIRLFDQALAVDPDQAAAHCNRAVALLTLGRWHAALTSCERAIVLDSGYAEAYSTASLVLAALGRWEDALARAQGAIALRPGHAESHHQCGNAQCRLQHFAAAVASYDRAIALAPGHAAAHANRAVALQALGEFDAALAAHDRSIALEPGSGRAIAARLFTRLHACDWRDWPADVAAVIDRIEHGEAAMNPFALMTFTDCASVLLRAATLWGRQECLAADATPPPLPHPAPRPTPSPHAPAQRIRVGYFSSDFRNHPVALLLAGLIEGHDRDRFEVTAFSFGPDTKDLMRRRLELAFDAFLDVRGLADEEVVRRARDRGIAIAVDLGGYTDGARPRIFALRAAPIQVSYLGYLGTLGTAFMDYLIADRTLIPTHDREHYAEKIVCLPHYQVNTRRQIDATPCTRAQFGLPEAGFVFCCFNACFKLVPATFSSWMRILHRVPGSVLFLYAEHAQIERNLRREAARAHVDPARLYFGKRLPVPEYLARYRTADLFLDTAPYNAGTTASDALWAGLPVLTRTGGTFSSRIAASALRAVGLPELITDSEDEYERRAVELARGGAELGAIKRKLDRVRAAAPLFDTARFTRTLENAYCLMVERHRAHLHPDHIDVD
jgi:predicted O-linked N-acetylglucosamine transferase (SPINDLY family)